MDNRLKDMERLMEIKKSYDMWQNSMAKRLDKYLPFPQEGIPNWDELVSAFLDKDFSRLTPAQATVAARALAAAWELALVPPSAQLKELEIDFLHSHIANFLNLKDEKDEWLDGKMPTIEVEVNGEEPDPAGPLCEFTFEYDAHGRLVPLEQPDALQLQNLQQYLELGKMPKAEKAGHARADKSHGTDLHIRASNCCLFCQYEAYFCAKPTQIMKWFDYKRRKEEKRRQAIRDKIERAKLRALERDEDNDTEL